MQHEKLSQKALKTDNLYILRLLGIFVCVREVTAQGCGGKRAVILHE